MTKLRIVAAVVDTRQVTLYQEDGSTVQIQQGDVGLRQLLDDISPIIASGQVAEVDYTPQQTNLYREFEEQTGGFVKFFRVAKKFVKNLFGDDYVPEHTIGNVPSYKTALDQIMDHAEPASSANFNNEATTEADTMVAVVGSGKSARAIPGVETLKHQFAHAVKLGSTKGVQNFLDRLGKVISQRQHSVNDLLRFMERGDLPITDDGSILIYKVLRLRQNNQFVDCHTRNVPQRVGSYVCMSPGMVDHNRRNECSNGLHVARRGYISNFHGDVCVLAKLAPEDVIAVPAEDGNKMRVCGYHILAVLDQADYNKLKQNKPITDTDRGRQLLDRALRDQFPAPIERVEITGSMGGGVKVTQLRKEPVAPTHKTKTQATAVALDIDKEPENFAPTIDPKEVAASVTTIKAVLSRKDQARALFNAGDLEGLKAFKKKSKVGYHLLGFSDKETAAIVSGNIAPPVPVKAAAKAASAPKKTGKPAAGTKNEARKLFNMRHWNTLRDLKKRTKKSWAALGFTADEELVIQYKIRG